MDINSMTPEERAVRAMAKLDDAKKLFQYHTEFDRTIAKALEVIADWSVGLVNDMDREQADKDLINAK